MKKISVVLSVYNCKEYLEECLSSIENQTMPKRDIDVIIIDDGSSDKSLKIINKYYKKNCDWKIISRDNRGLSFSRNEGLDLCNAEYVTFLDSDDYFKNDALENMYNEIKLFNAQIGLFKTKRFNSKRVIDDCYIEKFNSFRQIINLDSDKELASFIRSVAILYSRDIVKNIRFINNVVHEDNYFCIKAYSKAKTIYVSNTYVYMIREREGNNLSITQKLNINSYKNLFVNLNQADLEIRKGWLVKFHANQLYSYTINKLDRDERREAFNILKQYLYNMYKNKIISYKYYLYIKIYILIKKYFIGN